MQELSEGHKITYNHVMFAKFSFFNGECLVQDEPLYMECLIEKVDLLYIMSFFNTNEVSILQIQFPC